MIFWEYDLFAHRSQALGAMTQPQIEQRTPFR